MFSLGDIVMYGTSGACKILAEEEKEFFGKSEPCFVLESVFQNKIRIFVPKQNELLMSRMRKPLTKKEATAMLKNLPDAYEVYPVSDIERKQMYSEILASGDQEKIIAIIKTIKNKKIEQIENKKKLHQCDEVILREAKKLIHDEFALALGIERDKIEEYIENGVL